MLEKITKFFKGWGSWGLQIGVPMTKVKSVEDLTTWRLIGNNTMTDFTEIRKPKKSL